MMLTLTLNGKATTAQVDPVASLLDVLREELDQPGSKNACEQGECGSCSVLLDGALVCSCLVAAGQAHGCAVTTVEGVGSAEAPHPVQCALAEAGGVQCGFCTPGLVMATVNLLEDNPHPDDDQIREALAGNLCRCTGYQKVLDAVKLAAADLQGGAAS